jgi:CubicO group peptidase (beta-lactamase class C family)
MPALRALGVDGPPPPRELWPVHNACGERRRTRRGRRPHLLELIVRRPRLFAPGEGWFYSGSNYVVLGLLVEETTGGTLREELRRRIADPLGLAGTDLPEPFPTPAGLARGYFPADNPLLPDPGPRSRRHHGYRADRLGWRWDGLDRPGRRAFSAGPAGRRAPFACHACGDAAHRAPTGRRATGTGSGSRRSRRSGGSRSRRAALPGDTSDSGSATRRSR